MHDNNQYRPMPEMDFKEKGGHMFMATSPEFTSVNAPNAVNGAVPFTGRLLKDGINPIRYLVNLQDMAEELLKIISAERPISISNPQFNSENRLFDPLPYHTDLATIHQYAWDFGCKTNPFKVTLILAAI